MYTVRGNRTKTGMMKILQEVEGLTYQFEVGDKKGITINGACYQQTTLLTQDSIISPWGPEQTARLTKTHALTLCEYQPELVVIGQPQTTTIVPCDFQETLQQNHIGLEVMPLKTACATQMILAQENRQYVTLLFFGVESTTSIYLSSTL